MILLIFIKCFVTYIPDTFEIIHAFEQVITYRLADASYNLIPNVHYLKSKFSPERALTVYFPYRYYTNPNYIDVYGELIISEQYKKLFIKEIRYKYDDKSRVLLENTYYNIPNLKEKEQLLRVDNEPITINGKHFYRIGLSLNKKVNYHFIKGSLRQEKEVEITQIYSFDDEPLREERYKYKVTCGGVRVFIK